MKSIKNWLEELPEPYRTKALRNMHEQGIAGIAIKESLSNLLIDIARYDKTIASKQAQLHWANDTKDVLEGRYKEGLSTYIEVLDAESLILTAQLELLEAYYTKSTSIDQVDYLKGKIQ